MLRCLIIDDEPIARQIVRSYCAYFTELEIVAECEHALQAMDWLKRERIDLIFLDINMPVITGIAFLKSLQHPPKVIITTAYQEYAIEGYDLNVVDYLLKPFSIERFMRAVNKVSSNKQSEPQIALHRASEENALFIKAESKVFRFDKTAILFCEAQGNYTKIVTQSEVVEAYISLSKVEEQICSPNFVRCHRSFIINKNAVTAIESHRLYLGKTDVPIGSSYREKVFEAIGWKG